MIRAAASAIFAGTGHGTPLAAARQPRRTFRGVAVNPFGGETVPRTVS